MEGANQLRLPVVTPRISRGAQDFSTVLRVGLLFVPAKKLSEGAYAIALAAKQLKSAPQLVRDT